MLAFGDLLRNHRNMKGWTQAELAHRIGTNQTQVSQWETGREEFASWAIDRHFDVLLTLFDYPEDLLDWWVERQLTEIEQTMSKAHSFREQASRHRRPTSLLAKLDHLIERSRVHHVELAALRDDLKPLIGDGDDNG